MTELVASSAPTGARELPASADEVLAVLHGLPGMVGYWDRDMRNILANRAYHEYFGYDAESIRGLHIREVLGDQVYRANLPYITLALAGESQQFDRTLIDQNGMTRYVQASYVPNRVADQVQGFFVLVTDVSERVIAENQLKQSADQYRALAASIPGGFVLLFDEELRFRIAEGPELITFGHIPAELEGRLMPEVFSAELAAELEPRYRAALAGQTTEWERLACDRTFSLTAGPVAASDGTIFAGMVVARDVTEQRRTQAIWGALHRVARSVAQNEAPELIAAQIAESLNQVFNVQTAAVVRFTAPNAGLIVAMSPEQPASVPDQLYFSADDWSATAQVAQTGTPALVSYRSDSGRLVGALRSEGLRAGAAAPIHHDGVLWGAIALAADHPDRLGNDVLAQLTSFAELVEIALGNLQAWSTLAEQAAVDMLTQLPNRRTFEQHLGREIEQTRRTGTVFSVIAIDIDHFKRVNDRFGHPAGDRALSEVAARLKAVARNSEVLARLGGEEFVWLLPETGSKRATIAAERARAAIAREEFPGIGGLTISLGVCGTEAVPDARDILVAADEALYQAKRAGRNRTAVYGAPNRKAGRPTRARSAERLKAVGA